MRSFKPLAILAALALVLVGFGAVSADPPPESVDTQTFDLVILAGTEFSVEIIGSSQWDQVTFTLEGPDNWTDSAHYTMRVTDMRGTGAGWSVKASASPFTNGLTTGQVQNSNNTKWAGICGETDDGYCPGAGSIVTGVTSYSSSTNISTAPKQLLASSTGITGGQPNGTGTFTQQSAIYYTGIPDALAVGTYSTTVTLTLTGNTP